MQGSATDDEIIGEEHADHGGQENGPALRTVRKVEAVLTSFQGRIGTPIARVSDVHGRMLIYRGARVLGSTTMPEDMELSTIHKDV